jgi:hypothetical protein
MVNIEREMLGKSRIYIVLRECVARRDLGHSALSIAHAMAAASHKWQECTAFQVWRTLSFRKFLAIANEKEWQKMHMLGDLDKLVMHESGVEGNPELSMIFAPLCPDEVPNVLKHLRPLSWYTLVPASLLHTGTTVALAAPIGIWNKDIPDYADLIPVAEWLDAVAHAEFIDYDGHGHPVKGDKMDGGIFIHPSRVSHAIPEDATHIAWFNR